MRILQVAPRYAPNTGGVESHVQSISERMVELGHEVTVLTADAAPGLDSHDSRDGVDVRRYRSLAPGDAVYLAPWIAPAVRRLPADVVHVHNYHAMPLLFGTLGAPSTHLVATPHYHGASANPILDRLLSVYRPLGRRALRRADRVIAVSEWERDRLSSDLGVEASVVPNGVDLDRFAGATPEERQGPFLLFVGRLEEYKGVQYVVRALPELTDLELVIAGDGPYSGTLKETARDAGVADRVTLLGHVDQERLPGLYAGAEAYVTMSRFEAYGMTVAEALTTGTPCVVRTDAALREWTARAGVVGVDDPTPEQIRTAVTAARESTAIPWTPPGWDAVTRQVLENYRPSDQSL